MRLYAYCVCKETGAAAAVAGADGMCGAAARVVSCGSLAAIVSEVDTEGVTVTAEHVRAHNRVNARVLARTTPLPFRFGTIVAEGRLMDYLKTHAATLNEALARVGGCVEMSVKIMWDAGSKGGAPEDEPLSSSGSQPRSVGSGTAFLLAKRRELLGDEAERARAAAVAELLAARVADAARAARVAVRPTRSLVVRAAYLVERPRLEEYRSRIRALETERAGDLRFLTSGAWPPYSFSDIRS